MKKIKHIPYVQAGKERYHKERTFNGKIYVKKEEAREKHMAYLMARDWRDAGLNSKVIKDKDIYEVYIKNRSKRRKKRGKK